MEKLFSELNREFDLKLGNKSFSPIMQLSIGLAMKYHEKVERGFMNPFHLNFPDKLDAALWLSIAQLRNFLLEDYINQPEDMVEELELKIGDKVEIFGATAIYQGTVSNKLKLGFNKQDAPIDFDIRLTNYLSRTSKKVNKYSVFKRNWTDKKNNRNAISKLLEPKTPIYIDENIFNSKVLVISGRGNTGKFMKRLKDEYLFETPLSEVFRSGKNLILKPDLEDYTFLGIVEDPSIEKKFRDYFLKFLDELYEELPERKNDIEYLESLVDINVFRTKEFKQLFDDIVSECRQESKYHKIRDKYYPGIKEHLPQDLKSVIINDITQLDTYKGVIKKFLNRGIPVLVVSNRYIDDKKALSFFSNYFKTHSEDLRISWDKKKILVISELFSKDKNLLDNDLWRKFLKFSKQKISIETTESHPIDELLINIQRAISKLEGQERLRTAYWTYFSPLIYSYKNDTNWFSHHDELKDRFLSVFEVVKSTLDENIKSLFYEIFEKLDSHRESLKIFDSQSLLFGQQIEVCDSQLKFPSGDYKLLTTGEINGDLPKITFPGFPLNEPLHNCLLDAISDHFIQDVRIICWPKEGELTYNYLLKRLKAGYYSDNIPAEWGFPESLILRDETSIRKLIDEILIFDLRHEQEILETTHEAEEEILKKISTFKYSAYQSGLSTESDSKVICNIIDLHGNKFMFLPKTSSVMAKIETEDDRYEIKKVKFNELSPGDEIFQYELSRSRLRELSKVAVYQDNIFGKLELWKSSLKKTFIEERFDINAVLKRLKRIKSENNLNANPTYPNLRNWLFDDDMLSPEKGNLKMILLADSDPNNINSFSDIYDAYKKARGLSRKVSSEIKKMILEKLNSMDLGDKSHFEIDVFGSPMIIDFSKIKGLQKTDFEVEYQHTRKFKEA